MNHDLRSKGIIGAIFLLIITGPIYYLTRPAYEPVDEFQLATPNEIVIEFAGKARGEFWRTGYQRQYARIDDEATIRKLFSDMSEHDSVRRYPRGVSPRANTVIEGYLSGWEMEWGQIFSVYACYEDCSWPDYAVTARSQNDIENGDIYRFDVAEDGMIVIPYQKDQPDETESVRWQYVTYVETKFAREILDMARESDPVTPPR